MTSADPTPLHPDTHILRALAHDLDTGFVRLFETYRHVVFSVVLRICGRWADAEDLTAEAFLRAYRALATYRGGGRLRSLNPKAWLLTIATNLCRNDDRTAGRHPCGPLADQADVLADVRQNVEEAVANKETGAELAALLTELPEDQRAAIVLRHVADLPIAQIAEILDRPENTIKSDIKRGLTRLRATYPPTSTATPRPQPPTPAGPLRRQQPTSARPARPHLQTTSEAARPQPPAMSGTAHRQPPAPAGRPGPQPPATSGTSRPSPPTPARTACPQPPASPSRQPGHRAVTCVRVPAAIAQAPSTAAEGRSAPRRTTERRSPDTKPNHTTRQPAEADTRPTSTASLPTERPPMSAHRVPTHNLATTNPPPATTSTTNATPAPIGERSFKPAHHIPTHPNRPPTINPEPTTTLALGTTPNPPRPTATAARSREGIAPRPPP